MTSLSTTIEPPIQPSANDATSLPPQPPMPEPINLEGGQIPQQDNIYNPQTVSIPETVTIPESSPPLTVAGDNPPPPSRNVFKFIIPAILVILVIIGLIFGVRTALKMMEDSKQVTITYWGLWENSATMKTLISDFEKANPKIKVDYKMQSNREYRKRLESFIEQGKGPDVFRFHNTWVSMLYNQLEPVPSDVMTVSDFTTQFYPVIAKDLSVKNTIYGIPLMIDGLGLYINEDLFTSAGVVPPTSWEDIIKTGGLVDKLTVKNGSTIVKSAIALGTTGNVDHFSDIVGLLMLQNAVDMRDLKSSKAADSLTFFTKFADPNDPLYTWNSSLDNSVYAFAMGKVAMILAPSWRALDINQINSATKFKIMPVPQLPCEPNLECKPVTWASYWVEGVSNKSKYQKQAWEFVKYLTSKEGATQLYSKASSTRLFGEPYARKELAQTLENDPYVYAYIQQAENARSFPLSSRTNDEGLNDGLIKYLEDAINAMGAGASANDVLEKTIAPGFEQVLKQYGLVSSSPASQTQ